MNRDKLVDLILNDYEAFEIEHKQDVKATFALKQISEFAKSAPLSEKVKIHLNMDNPLIMEFKGDASVLKFYLAPKYDEDEEVAE